MQVDLPSYSLFILDYQNFIMSSSAPTMPDTRSELDNPHKHPRRNNLSSDLVLMPDVTKSDKEYFLLQGCNKILVTIFFVTKYLLQSDLCSHQMAFLRCSR
jgi:hypothetical protein